MCLKPLLTINDSVYDPDHPQVANILLILGNLYEHLEDFQNQHENLKKEKLIEHIS